MWADLNQVIVRACAQNPFSRHPSAQAMVEELLLVRAGESVGRLRALERRQRVVVRLAVAVLALVGVGIVAFLRERGHFREREALSRANREQAVRLHLSEGFRRLDELDLDGSLPSFLAAWALEEWIRRGPRSTPFGCNWCWTSASRWSPWGPTMGQ